MDRDETPIGGLLNPMQPTRQLLMATLVMDLAAVALSFLISPMIALGIMLYILASRAYSWRGIRLKRFAVLGFLTVFIFQGALIYLVAFYASSVAVVSKIPLQPALIASCLIGALYPLTQIYQHEADRQDGVKTISMLVGKRGSFILSLLLFIVANLLMYDFFSRNGQSRYFILFTIFNIPVVLFFCFWMWKVWRNEAEANFKNSFRMNLISTVCTTLFFITLFIQNH